MNDNDYKRFLCDYDYDGGKYCVDVYARSFGEASERLRAIGLTGSVNGTHEFSVPGWAPRWFMDLLLWWHNRRTK